MTITWIALLLQGLVVNAFGFHSNTDFLSWLIIFINSLVFLMSMALKYNPPQLFFIIALGYLARLVLLYVDRTWLGFLIQSGADTESFYWHGLNATELPDRISYYGVLFLIFSLFGPQRLIAQYVNLLLGVHTILLGHGILKKFNHNNPVAETVMLMVAMFLPHFMILNVILLREAVISFSIGLSLFWFINWFKQNHMIWLILSIVAILVASTFHSASFSIAMGYALVIVFYDQKYKEFRFNKSTIIWCVTLFFAYLIIDDLWGDVLFVQAARFNDAGDLADHMARDAAGGAGFSFFIPTGIPVLDLIVNTPIRAMYFLLAPMPWDWRGFGDIFSFAISSLFYGIFLVTVILSIRNPKQENPELLILLLLVSIMSAMVFSMGVRNAGTAMRHRDKFFVQYVLMFSLCIGQNIKDHTLSRNKKLHRLLFSQPTTQLGNVTASCQITHQKRME